MNRIRYSIMRWEHKGHIIDVECVRGSLHIAVESLLQGSKDELYIYAGVCSELDIRETDNTSLGAIDKVIDKINSHRLLKYIERLA